MASNPRPMANNGIRNPRIEANDGKGAWALVNRRKNTNGSDDVVWRMPCRAPYSAATAVSTTRSEEHTSELQSLMRISYAVFCLKQKKYHQLTRSLLIVTTINH